MTDVPRRSPWLPVNGPDPSEQQEQAPQAPVTPPAASVPSSPSVPSSASAGSSASAASPAAPETPPETPAAALWGAAVSAPNPQAGPAVPEQFPVPQSSPASPVAIPQLDTPPAPARRQSFLSPYLAPREGDPQPTTGELAGLTPTKPTLPTHTRQPLIPEPIEAVEADVIRPVMPPPAEEILPTSGSISTDAVIAAAHEEPAASEPPLFDPVRALGHSAVTNATFEAAGAPTPAVGLPQVGDVDEALPAFEVEQPFVPRFEPDAPVAATSPASADPFQPTEVLPALAPEEAPLPDSPVPPPARPLWAPVSTIAGPSEADLEAANRRARINAEAPLDPTITTGSIPSVAGPSTATGGVPAVLPGASSPSSPAQPPLSGEVFNQLTGATTVTAKEDKVKKPWYRKAWIWIVAVVILAGAGFAAYKMFLSPEPIILPTPTVTQTPPGPEVDPVAVGEDDALVASLPQAVATYALTSYETLEPVQEPGLGARIAGHATLSYGQAAGEESIVVEAFQFYNEDEAQVAWEAWTVDGTEAADVLAGPEIVGRSAVLAGGAADTIVWRNGTLVLKAAGPSEDVRFFFEHYGM